MRRTEKVCVKEGNLIELPHRMINYLAIKKGDKIELEWECTPSRSRCFFIREDNEEERFNEGFYCIPERYFERCGIPIDGVQILEDTGSLTLMTSDRLIASLGPEVIACLTLQNIDIEKFADDLANCINEIYENECL